jgi:hypothetical protein
VGGGEYYTVYAANISAWAGDTEQLTFSALEGYAGANNWLIDDISFSTNAVTPEPNIVALSAIGHAQSGHLYATDGSVCN